MWILFCSQHLEVAACRTFSRSPLLSLAGAQEPEDRVKAVGTQPGAGEYAPNEPPHPPQGRSHCTPLSFPRPWQRRSPKEPICSPDPETQASSSWDPGVRPQFPGILISLPPAFPGLLLQDLPGCPLRVHVLSLINVHSFFPSLCLCVVVCGQPRTGREVEVVVPFLLPPLLFLLLLLQGLLFSPHSFLQTFPRGLPFSLPLSPFVSPRPSSGGHRPQSPITLHRSCFHPCLWGLEAGKEMTELLWSPPALARAPGHTLRPEAAPTRDSHTPS